LNFEPNAAKRAVLERRIRSTVTMAECEAAMERIQAAVSGDLLKLPAGLSRRIAFGFGSVDPAGKLSVIDSIDGKQWCRADRVARMRCASYHGSQRHLSLSVMCSQR